MEEQNKATFQHARRISSMLFLGSSRRVWIVLVINALVHTIPSYDSLAIIGNMADRFEYRYYLAVGMGITFLAFSIFGWVAEMVQRYHLLVCSLAVLLVGFMAVSVPAGVTSFIYPPLYNNTEINAAELEAPIGITVLIIMIGFGMFEANALRFGTDQLPDASSEEHSIYVQWYYWVTQLGPFLISCACITTIFIICNFSTGQGFLNTFYLLSFGSLLITALFILVGLIFFCAAKKHVEVQTSAGNPFKIIFSVLRYTWNHTRPEHRSAFTYWEDDIPARFDLGKNKYGGPFTNEEVESVKSFFLVLLVLCTLFGYQIAGDTFSVSQLIKQYGCPSPSVILLIGINPQQVSYVVTLIAIPLMQLRRLQCCCRVSMLKRMGLGLLCCLLQEISSTSIGITAGLMNQQAITYNITNTGLVDNSYHLTLFGCYATQTTNSTPIIQVANIDAYYLWLLVPQLLGGMAQLLVFMTALQFISAQAPYTLQGILIGVWYSMYFINFLIVGTLDTAIIEHTLWCAYHGTKIAIILVSLLLYWYVASRYKQRERNEVVNENWMIEQVYDRMLKRREEYERLHIEPTTEYGTLY